MTCYWRQVNHLRLILIWSSLQLACDLMVDGLPVFQGTRFDAFGVPLWVCACMCASAGRAAQFEPCPPSSLTSAVNLMAQRRVPLFFLLLLKILGALAEGRISFKL